MSAGAGVLLVRAEVPDPAHRERFDEWYRTHHLRLAAETLGAERATRYWSRSDPSVHYALYTFASMDKLRDGMASPGLETLLRDFDSAWPDGVTRTRELVELVQELDRR